MDDLSRRSLICAASVGVVGPLIVDSTTGAADAAGAAVIATSKVPVGGGVVVSKRKVVVTQPRKGAFRVFSATCTHEGCAVTRVAQKKINCPCHGSQFAISNGSVVTGPATRSLPARKFKISQGKIYLT